MATVQVQVKDQQFVDVLEVSDVESTLDLGCCSSVVAIHPIFGRYSGIHSLTGSAIVLDAASLPSLNKTLESLN